MVVLDQLKDDAILIFAYLSGDAQQFRTRVTNLAANFRDHPGDLRKYLFSPEDTPLLNGLVTSAYARITGDPLPMLDLEYGGLGAAATKRGSNLIFGGNQLHFAKLSGTALQGAAFNGNSGYGSEFSEQAGQGSYVSKKAMKCSRNSGDAFMYGTFADKAFEKSHNTERALLHGKYLGTEILQGSVNHPELQKIVDQLERLDAIRKVSREVLRKAFPPRQKEGPEGARMLPGFSRFY